MNKVTIKDAIDILLEDLVIDKHLLDKLYRYHVNYVNQSYEYMDFFSSNLIGVHIVRFRQVDISNFFAILNIDVKDAALSVKTITTVNHDYKVATDPMNICIIYLMHRITNDKKLSTKDKERGLYDLALIFFYRCLVIRQSEYFHFPADPKVAQAAYAELSNKFLVKQLGSWNAVVSYRAKELIDNKSIHYKSISTFNDDDDITYLIQDSEGRIRSLYKNYTKVFYDVQQKGIKISSTSLQVTDVDGEQKILDRISETDRSINTVLRLISDEISFIKDDYLVIILDINTNTSYRLLKATIHWLSQNSIGNHRKLVNDVVKIGISYSYNTIQEATDLSARDIPGMLIYVKNRFISTKNKDKQLTELHAVLDKIMRLTGDKLSSSLILATKTAVVLYIFLFSLVCKS